MVAQAGQPARAPRAASAPSRAGARRSPQRRPKLRATCVSSRAEPSRSPRASAPRPRPWHSRRSPAPRWKDAPDTANEGRQRGSLAASPGDSGFHGRGSSVGSARRDLLLRLALGEPCGDLVASARPHAHPSWEDAASLRRGRCVCAVCVYG